jgi:hypothetical protein
MSRKLLKKTLLALASGLIVLQTASCTMQVTAISTSITAFGVLYIVRRIID